VQFCIQYEPHQYGVGQELAVRNTFIICTYFNLEGPDPFIVTVIVIYWHPSNENEEKTRTN